MSFELTFDGQRQLRWLNKNWSISIWISLFYVVCVYIGRKCMMSRERFDLRKWLCMWNCSLAVFGIICCSRMVSEMLFIWNHRGFTATICVTDTLVTARYILWGLLFNISKVIELGDTVFIVLRKQPLYFLHWYHHVTVLVYVWYSSGNKMSTCLWFGTMNITIHSLMYTYYALKSLRVRVPRFVSIALTSVQISQMAVGVAVSVLAHRVSLAGQPCEQSTENMVASLIMYASYLILFVHFFCKTYIFTSNSKKLTNASMQNATKYKTDCAKND